MLFGLAGATPGFAMHEFEMERVFRFFLHMTAFSFYLWLINLLLLKYLDGRKKRLDTHRFVLSIIICIITSCLVNLYILPQEMGRRIDFINAAAPLRGIINDSMMAKNFPVPRPPFNSKMIIFPVLQTLSIDIIIIVLIELVRLKETKQKVDYENELLKLANLEARNSQLKQQLHPHFLFNSLSTLRSLITRSPQKAEEYVERLSELLRFSTDNSHQSLISLKEEVELCNNYLVMQQTRFGDAIYFSIDIPVKVQQSGKVPVFALQQLTENAVKHNVLTKEQPLYIRIATDEKGEWAIIKNNLQPKQTLEYSSGVGLANLSERYNLTGAEDIIIKKEDGEFSVAIKILYDAGNNN
ncbi:MAG TPA: histidine kinase [Ferruginibacter sp.]|nr:histidine kinase [Ferruginibacter sp.]